MKFARTTAAVLVIVMLISASARGQVKTDVVTLVNGDRITGEIKSMDRGLLEFETDDAGTIHFEWGKIRTVEAARLFEVHTSDGLRFLGSLGPTGDPFVLRLIAGGGSTPLPMPDVTLITPIGASFWAKIDGSVDGGFNYTRSSGISQTTLNTQSVYRRPDFLLRLTGSATVTTASDDSENDDRAAAELSYVRYRGARWFVSGAGRVESNESLGLLLRSQAGVMTGVRAINTNRAELEASAGMVVNDEQGVDTPSTQNVEGLLAFRTSFYSYDRPKTNLNLSIQYYPSLSNWGRQRLQFDFSVKRELFKDFSVGVNLFDTFDSTPPNPDAARNDVGTGILVGWSY